MIREINVDAFLKQLGQGISKPVLIIGSDYEQYVLKNERADYEGKKYNFNCMFLNELLSYQIGKYLEVPIPESVIAYVDNRLIEADPTIRFAYRFAEGNHFASKELKYVENNMLENMNILRKMGKPYIKRSWNAFFSNIKNKDDVAKILAFDLLIANFDRYGNEGNILIENTNLGRKIFAIDHGHAFFGPEWTTKKINMLTAVEKSETYVNNCINGIININLQKGFLNGLGTIFKELETYIDLNDTNNHSFQDIIMRIETITEELLDDWLNNIPNEWFINRKVQIGCYKNFILTQQALVRYFIQALANRGAFSNFRGGILQWKKEKQFGTA
ncbi:HipA family kinase [Tissierella sp.]|uniref:HipA family kinase n=1 Tax=Tissierella sp. TaxID=41274 RepID=UPI0030246B75